MATNPIHRENMDMDDGDGPEDVGAESSYGLTFTAEDAAVLGVHDVVLPSNLLSAIAGASPSAAPGYGLFSSSNPALGVDHGCDVIIPGPNSVDSAESLSSSMRPWTKPPPVPMKGSKRRTVQLLACKRLE